MSKSFVAPYNIPTADIDLEYPCSGCGIYKGGDDACLDCPVMARWSILTGRSEPDDYCPECDSFQHDAFYVLSLCPECGTALEHVEKVV